MTVLVQESSSTATIIITAERDDLVDALETELLEILSDDVIPESFFMPKFALEAIERNIDRGNLLQLECLCINRPDREIVDALIACSQERSLVERLGYARFPDKQSKYKIGRIAQESKEQAVVKPSKKDGVSDPRSFDDKLFDIQHHLT